MRVIYIVKDCLVNGYDAYSSQDYLFVFLLISHRHTLPQLALPREACTCHTQKEYKVHGFGPDSKRKHTENF